MGLDFVLTCDPANAKHMYNTRFNDYPKGDEFLEIFDVLGNGILTVDGDMWSKQRRMAVAHISTHSFRSSVAENSRDKVHKALLPILDGMAGMDRVLDLQDVMKRFSMDVTSRQLLGKDPGSLARDFPDVPFPKAVEDAEEVLFYRHVVPRVWWKLLRRLQLGEEKRMAVAMDVVDRYIAGCIEEKRSNEADQSLLPTEESRDLLTSYMYQYSLKDHEDIDALVDREDQSKYFTSDNFLRDTLLTFLSAGTDTIAYGLSWFLWLVAESPNVEKKILEELRELRPKLEGEVAGKQFHVTFDFGEIEGLVYLHAALCETLRLFPTIPFNHKVAMKDDILPSGHRVRVGTKILFSTYSTGRMKKFWGEDCMEFKPERWINSSNGQLKHVHAHEFLAFHSGPKSCLGKNMAMTRMKVAAAAIIYNFHIEVEEDCKVQPKLSIVLGMKNGLMVKIRKRQGH